MNFKPFLIPGVIAVAVVVGVIAYLQNFDAAAVECIDIPAARAELQAQYDKGVDASVELYREARKNAEERQTQCLLADPVDPCAAEQAARDAAYRAFFDIPSPADDAPYEEFKAYYDQREVAYQNFVVAKNALEACWAANPKKTDIPYEESDTKKCFDEYDAAMDEAQERFRSDTQTMRSALQAAMAALDARELACNPATGDDAFSLTPGTGPNGEDFSENILSCMPTDIDSDAELRRLKARVTQINVEIQSIDTTIENANKRASKHRVDLSNVDTWIPPESSKTQFEGALNALRGERKVSIEQSLEYYDNLIDRKQNEKTELEDELRDTENKIQERMAELERENQMRAQKYPTNVRLAGPDECKFFHCHGTICGIPDPNVNGCGHGVAPETDVNCEAFIEAFIKAGSS